MSKVTIIAVTGASASGKSLLVDTIYNELLPQLGKEGLVVIREDSYYKNQEHLALTERAKTNYDHPAAFEHDLLIADLERLSLNNSIQSPNYCYKTHTRSKIVTEIKAAKVILVEGILLFTHPRLLELFDVKIYMDVPIDICLIRRIKRDVSERGRCFQTVLKQFTETVRPMFYQYIEPSRHFADITISQGGENRVAIEMLKAKINQLDN
jgi:uridine kinase